MPVDPPTLSARKQFVAGLRARGGTEMLPALEIALAGAPEASILRQVVFLTDGAVGNEDADPQARRASASATGACSPSASARRPTCSS